MSDIKIFASMRAEQVAATLLGINDKLMAAVRRAVIRLSIQIQSDVKLKKLTGQVLHVRTGTLRRSINRKITETPNSIIATVGTNVKYAGVHEYGINKLVNVKAHVRKTVGGGTAQVRGFSRRMDLPARSFLRSTLSENQENIRSTLKRAVTSAFSSQPNVGG
jgi:phage gpG-like protein